VRKTELLKNNVLTLFVNYQYLMRIYFSYST